MADPPRPKWLPTTGPGNLNVDPKNWGMTLRQWTAFIMGCMVCSDAWAELLADTDRKDTSFEYVNLYQICNKFVKPWTRNLGNSIALLLNAEKPLKAEVMISHAWGEDIVQTVVAVLGRASISGISLETPVWFCTFAQYQPGDMEGDCGPGVAAQLAMDPFKKVIEDNPRYGMLVIHTSVAELYGRLWCVYEVNASQDHNVLTSAAPSMLYFMQCYTRGEEGESPEDICAVSSQEATCWSPEDEKMIKQKIEEGIGYEALNDKIFNFRNAALTRMARAAQNLLEWSEPMCEKYGLEPEVCIKALVNTVRCAGGFLALHCLATVSDGHEDDEYMQKLMEMARENFIKGMKVNDPAGNPIESLPEAFDPRKRASDEFLDALMTDDDLLRQCLLDMSEFQHPYGWLELGAGGNYIAVISSELEKFDKEESLEKVREIFAQFDDDGNGEISEEELAKIFMALGMPEDDIQVMFAAADANRDGVISIDEFMTWLDRN